MVEPWAYVGKLEPGGELLIEMNGENSSIEFVWAEDGPLFYVWADSMRVSHDAEVFDYELPETQRGRPPPSNLRTFAIIFRGAKFS